MALLGCTHDTTIVEEQVVMEPPVLIIHQRVDEVSWEEKNWCDLSFVDDNGDTLFSNLKGQIKYRGGQSSAYPKHSFTIELSKPFKLLGLDEEDDWMVLASYSDKSFMRNKLAYDLFLEMGQIAPNTAYLNLIQGGVPQGLYLLCERMDTKRLDITKTDSAAFIFKDPHIFRMPDTSSIPEVYHHEMGSEQKHPLREQNDKTWLMAHLQQLIHHAGDEAFVDPNSGVPALFDLDNIIDWHLLLLVTNNGDGIAKNFYLYRQSQRSRIKICPWDYDHTFGRMGDNEPNWEGRISLYDCTFFDRLVALDPNNYVDRLQRRYKELVEANVLTSEHLITLTEEYYLEIEPFLASNALLWPIDSDLYFDNNSTEDELDLMRDWIEQHMGYVSTHIESLPSTRND